MSEIRILDPFNDGELVRRVYARSWPHTCRSDFSADAVISRLGDRDLLWWQRKLAAAPIRIGGESALGGSGFALAAPADGRWEMSYLFVEPEAFGSGLAAELHDAVIEQLREVTDVVDGWVLRGNERSQRFLARRGWTNHGLRTPPWVSTAQCLHFERSL
jgi:RimJ/RimL family protein N-acetyltransferase